MTCNSVAPRTPPGWAWTTLGEVVDPVPLTGRKLPQGQYLEAGPLPIIDQGQKLVGGYTDRLDLRIHVERPVIVFGDHTRAIKYVDFDFVAGADGIKPLVPWEVYFPKLFYYFLQALRLPDKGYARHFQFLAKFSLPLPPEPEQRRIVAKIEELFSQLDAGVEELKKAKAQLKRYRQSVLKAAFEGKLTEDWRKAHKGKVEPASVLLERIKAERKKALGPKYKEPLPLDTSELPALPKGWAWARLDDIGLWFGGGTPSTGIREYWEGGDIPWVTSKDMKSVHVVDSQVKITERALEASAAAMIPTRSLLFVVRSGILRRILPIAIADVPITVNQDLKALVPSSLLSADYLLWATIAASDDIRHTCAKDGTTVESIEVPALRAYAVPVCPNEEQLLIVQAVELALSVVDAGEKTIEAALKQATRLRQSILKRAFEGRLVPQDPSDEPAEKLLERIRAEKAKRAAGQPRGRRTTMAGR